MGRSRKWMAPWSVPVLLKSTQSPKSISVVLLMFRMTVLTPLCQILYLQPVFWLVPVVRWVQPCCVVCNLHLKVLPIVSSAFVSHQCIQQWAEHRALERTSAHDNGGGCSGVDPETLWPRGQKVQDPTAQGEIKTQCCSMTVLNAVASHTVGRSVLSKWKWAWWVTAKMASAVDLLCQ